MNIIFLLVLIFSGAENIFADNPAFVYNDHRHQDPFWPQVSATGIILTQEESLAVGDMILEGIVADAQGKNVAIINGKIVKKGDTIGVYSVAEVRSDEVDVLKDGERFTVKLKKGGM